MSCFPPPDSSRWQHHSAGKAPTGHLHDICQPGLAGTARVRGVRLPQRQDLPLSRRACLYLPSHEQHLPLELTWEQRQRSQMPAAPAQELLRWETHSLVHRISSWQRWNLFTIWAPISLSGVRTPAPLAVWEQLSEMRRTTYRCGRTFPPQGQNLYFSTVGSL